MQDARAKTPSSSAPACPACRKALDPLRAGEVSILDGRFTYFCDKICKAAFYEANVSSRVTADALTHSPPVVAPAPRPPVGSADDVPISDVRARDARRAERDDAPLEAPTTLRSIVPSAPVVAAPLPAASDVDEPREDEPSDDEPSVDEPSDSVATDDATSSGDEAEDTSSASEAHEEEALETAPVRPSPPAARPPARDLLAYAGIGAGILAGAVAVVGPSGEGARLPLAALAAAGFVVRAPRALRDPALPHAALSIGAPLVALLAAVVARVAEAPHAPGLASFAGLAAAASLVGVVLVERTFVPLAAERARIAKALDVPVRVVSRAGGEIDLTPAAEVKAGEEVVVEAGDVVGVDGVVTAGEAAVLPWLDATHEVTRREGEAVVAGARVVRGSLRLMTTWAANDRAWFRAATATAYRFDVKAPLARGARVVLERVSLAAAVLLGAAFLVTDASGVEAVAAAAAATLAFSAFGVIAAVATHHARAQIDALAHGVAFKDPAAFHQAGATDVAVLCARGTVLLGEPEIVALETLGALDEETVLSLAAGAETVSTHPFASAVVRAARARGVTIENVRNANEHAGLGVTALSAAGEPLAVGSRALLLQERVSVALADARISELEAQGRSVLLVALNDKLVGIVALQDGLRAGARAAVQKLHDARIEPVLLSGEARETCETIARALDIDHIRPEVLPPDRGAEVRALGEGGHVVAVLGQPRTDDAALGAADVSIALGAAGSTPGEWSAGLASEDVRDAALALCLARVARERSRVALIVGLAPSVLAVLAVAFALAPLSVVPLACLVGTFVALSHARR